MKGWEKHQFQKTLKLPKEFERFNDHFLTNTPDSKTGGFLNHAFINFEGKKTHLHLLIKDTLDIRQRVWLLSIPFYFIFFLPFPVRWQRPRVKFAALPPSPTWWSPSRETRLTTNCLPHVGGPHHYAKHLWKDGTLCLEGGFGARWTLLPPVDQKLEC